MEDELDLTSPQHGPFFNQASSIRKVQCTIHPTHSLHTHTSTNSAQKSSVSTFSNLYRILIYTELLRYNYNFNAFRKRLSAHIMVQTRGSIQSHSPCRLHSWVQPDYVKSVNNLLDHKIFLLKNQSPVQLLYFLKRVGEAGWGFCNEKERRKIPKLKKSLGRSDFR